MCFLFLGKKFAILARKYNAITLIDFLKVRYNSTAVVLLAAISMIIFLFSAMTAQWVGGGRLIESLTGMQYTTALFIFAVSVLVYVVIGGFRAVAVTDAVQGGVYGHWDARFIDRCHHRWWRGAEYYARFTCGKPKTFNAIRQ